MDLNSFLFVYYIENQPGWHANCVVSSSKILAGRSVLASEIDLQEEIRHPAHSDPATKDVSVRPRHIRTNINPDQIHQTLNVKYDSLELVDL